MFFYKNKKIINMHYISDYNYYNTIITQDHTTKVNIRVIYVNMYMYRYIFSLGHVTFKIIMTPGKLIFRLTFYQKRFISNLATHVSLPI